MSENQGLRSSAAPATVSSDPWRKEIHARVAGYRTRRGRRVEGAFSMRFPFPDHEGRQAAEEVEAVESFSVAADTLETVAAPEPDVRVPPLEPIPIPTSELRTEASSESQTITEPNAPATYTPDPEPVPIPQPRPRSRRKVIAFPRPAIEVAPASHRLADPVLPEQPRILDVPEELEALPTTPFLDGLRFELEPGTATRDSEHAELPFRPASLPQRLYAAALDFAMVGIAAGIFATAAYKFLPKLVLTKPLVLITAIIPVLLWAAYQYLLVVYGSATLGMQLAGVCLKNFDGKLASFRQRQTRVMALYLSAASLAMGLMWAFVDLDALCWHDRISRTYLAASESPR